MTKIFKITILTLLTLNSAFAFTIGTNLKYNSQPTYNQHIKSINIANQQIQFINSDSNKIMDLYIHGNKYYLAGNIGDNYYIKICSKNLSDEQQYNSRILNIVSVDGINVLTSEPAGYEQSGYILNNSGSCTLIKGWKKNINEEIPFVFRDYYNINKQHHHNNNIGIIGIASFKENIDSINNEKSILENSENFNDRKDFKVGTNQTYSNYYKSKIRELEKSSEYPYSIIKVYYDSYSNLASKGIILKSQHNYNYNPNPFPNSQLERN